MKILWDSTVLAMLGCIAAPCPASADCLDYDAYPDWTAGIHMQQMNDVARTGDTIYGMGGGPGSGVLTIFDVSDLTESVVVCTAPNPARVAIFDPAGRQVRTLMSVGSEGMIASDGRACRTRSLRRTQSVLHPASASYDRGRELLLDRLAALDLPELLSCEMVSLIALIAPLQDQVQVCGAQVQGACEGR